MASKETATLSLPSVLVAFSLVPPQPARPAMRQRERRNIKHFFTRITSSISNANYSHLHLQYSIEKESRQLVKLIYFVFVSHGDQGCAEAKKSTVLTQCVTARERCKERSEKLFAVEVFPFHAIIFFPNVDAQDDQVLQTGQVPYRRIDGAGIG